MENASKALIIAGSILVSIVIITLGVMIVGNVTDLIRNNSSMSAEEVQAANSRFEGYEGTKSGTQVRNMCDAIRNFNNTQDDVSKKIVLSNNGTANTAVPEDTTSGITTTDINNIKATVKAGKTYTVTLGYDDASGKIVGIDAVVKQ